MRRGNLSPTVTRNERSIWNLYITDPQCSRLGHAGFHNWTLLEGRCILAAVFEYAATLGLIDIAYSDPAGEREDFRGNWGTDDQGSLSRYDDLHAIPVNAWVPTFLGSPRIYRPQRPSPPSRSRYLPNHDVVALGAPPSVTR